MLYVWYTLLLLLVGTGRGGDFFPLLEIYTLCRYNNTFFPSFSQFEEKFEETNGVAAPENHPSSSGLSFYPGTSVTGENRRGNSEVQGQDHVTCSDPNASQDFVSGILKIVPSDVDVSFSFSVFF